MAHGLKHTTLMTITYEKKGLFLKSCGCQGLKDGEKSGIEDFRNRILLGKLCVITYVKVRRMHAIKKECSHNVWTVSDKMCQCESASVLPNAPLWWRKLMMRMTMKLKLT